MIYINHEKKAIFIHIPKTGGTYIGPTLVKYYGFTSYLDLIAKRRPDHHIICKPHYFKPILTHNPTYDNSFFNKVVGILEYCKSSDFFQKAMNMDANKWNSYVKFCFIRNPYDRLLSGWKHINIILKKETNFYDYINQNKYNVSDIEYGHTFMSQYKQIQNIDGTCGVDVIGKFESLEEDFRIILQKIGFTNAIHIPEKKNVSNTNGSNIIALERKTIKKINELLEDDLSTFHYKKLLV